VQQDGKKAAKENRRPKHKINTYEELHEKLWWISIPPSLISIAISLYMILKILKIL